jgi:hypothetical protein
LARKDFAVFVSVFGGFLLTQVLDTTKSILDSSLTVTDSTLSKWPPQVRNKTTDSTPTTDPVIIQWYPKLFPWVKNVWDMMLATNLHLVPRSRMVELYLHSPYAFMTWCLINYA